MGELSAVLDGLTKRLQTVVKRTTPYEPDSVTPTCAWVTLAPEGVNYQMTMGESTALWNCHVTVVMVRGAARTTTDYLSKYLSRTGLHSIKHAIESEETLDGAAFSSTVTGARAGLLTIGQQQFVAVEFDVEVIA